MSLSRCSVCKKDKPIKDFYKVRSLTRGYSYRCKSCDKEACKKYHGIFENRKISRYREYKYGITDEGFSKILRDQNGKCAICEIALDYFPGTRKHKLGKLNIDHCHKTNKVRGFLCQKCNSGLGMFNDDYGILTKATRYLEKFASVH